MAKFSGINIYPANDAPEEPIALRDVDKVSFIDAESHGKGEVFGLTETFGVRAVIICSPNVTAVEVVK